MYAILNDELYHHGIKGQHWGIRRFQNADGSLKPAGKNRYETDSKGRIHDSNSPMNQIKRRQRYSTDSKGRIHDSNSPMNKTKSKEKVLNNPLKNTKEKFDNLDPKVKKAFAAATAVTLATVLLSKNAHKNDAKQRIKRTEKRAKFAERSLNRFQL